MATSKVGQAEAARQQAAQRKVSAPESYGPVIPRGQTRTNFMPGNKQGPPASATKYPGSAKASVKRQDSRLNVPVLPSAQ